jgi:hypothetical protein
VRFADVERVGARRVAQRSGVSESLPEFSIRPVTLSGCPKLRAFLTTATRNRGNL